MQGNIDKTAEKKATHAKAEQEKAHKKAAHEKAEQEKAAQKKAAHEKAEREENQEKAYKWVKNGLKDIKKALQHCDNAEHFHSIVASYESIDVKRTEVQEYLKANHRSRASLIDLEKDIASLIMANRHIYGEKKPEPEVLTRSVDKKIVVDTAPSNTEGKKPQTETTITPPVPETIQPPTSVMTQPSVPIVTTPPTPIITTPPVPVVITPPVPVLTPLPVSVVTTPSVPVITTPPVPVTTKSQELTITEPPVPITTKPQEPVTTLPEEPVQTTVEEEQKQKTAQLRAVRETQLTEFTKYLKQLMAKRDQFHNDYPKDPPENPHKIYGAMNLLVQSLEQSAESYKSGVIDLDQFKSDTTQAIRDKRDGVISQHRGSKEILVNLLLAISTLGIGYLLAALFTRSFTPIKVNTDSVNQLDETKEAVNRLHA